MSATAPKVNGNGRARVQRVIEAAEAPKVPGLMDALGALQADAPKLARDATGQIQNRNYRYVTLDGLLDAIVPLLASHDLVWVTLPTRDSQGEPALRYQLTHIPSGECIQDTMPLMSVRPDPQGQGSAITYARRYALMAVLNLAPGEDDDGAAASNIAFAEAEPAALPSAPATSQPTAAAAKPSERPANAKQRNLIRVRARDIDLTPAELANVILVASEEERRDWPDDQAAERWTARALDRLPARLVNPVLAGIAHKNGGAA